MALVMAFQFMDRLIIPIRPCIHIQSRCLCPQRRRYTFNKTFRNKTTRKTWFSHNPAIGIIAGNRKVIILMSRIVPVTGYKSLHSHPRNNVVCPKWPGAGHIDADPLLYTNPLRRVLFNLFVFPSGYTTEQADSRQQHSVYFWFRNGRYSGVRK